MISAICRNMPGDTTQNIEKCFFAAVTYAQRLRIRVKPLTLGQKDQIFFYRHVFPRFASEAEYYNLLYHAAVFAPGKGEKNELAFWRRELERFKNFKAQYAEFYHYFESGETDRDEEWFLPKINHEDVVMEYVNVGDMLCSKFLALERYTFFLYKKIASLPLD